MTEPSERKCLENSGNIQTRLREHSYTQDRQLACKLMIEAADQIDRLIRFGNDLAMIQEAKAGFAMLEHEQLKSMVRHIITTYEDGENHDEDAFDADCPVCPILKELRSLPLTPR